MPLKTVEELVGVILDVGAGEKARLVTVLARIDRKATSSATQSLLASASRSYGLVIGTTSDTHLSLTERGANLATAKTEYERRAMAFQALNQNEIFRAFVEKFKHRPMPSDEVAIDFAKDSFGLSDADASAAIKVAKRNLADYGLTEVVGDREVVNPPDEVLEGLRSDPSDSAGDEVASLDAKDEPLPSSGTKTTKPKPTETVSDIIPQIAFNIQIQLPSDASPETYDAIFRNIATHLLRRASE